MDVPNVNRNEYQLVSVLFTIVSCGHSNPQ
jgi:hypothetical protein